MRNLSAVDLKSYLDTTDSDPLLLDVREGWEFERYHIEGSTLIPMGQIPSTIAELDSQRETVIICAHGIRSYHVGAFLEHYGFRSVINLKGGVAEWARDIEQRSDIT